jgi:hypothetical protein
MNEFQRELVKETLSEVKKSKQTIDWAFERLEKLCNKLLEESEKKDAASEPKPA